MFHQLRSQFDSTGFANNTAACQQASLLVLSNIQSVSKDALFDFGVGVWGVRRHHYV